MLHAVRCHSSIAYDTEYVCAAVCATSSTVAQAYAAAVCASVCPAGMLSLCASVRA